MSGIARRMRVVKTISPDVPSGTGVPDRGSTISK
jgi:hypothetical protein